MSRDSGIYEIVNLANGKRYVGSAVNLSSRWKHHRAKLRHGKHCNRHLQGSWNKHGEENFVFRLIEICLPEDLIRSEQAAIDRLSPELNICPTAGSTRGCRHSAETRRKIGARKVGLKLPPRDAEYRAAASARQKGRPKAPEHLAKLQAGRKRHVRTVEQRQQVSESLKAAYQDGRHRRDRPPEYREKIATSLRGRKATNEHRRNQSAAQAGKKRGPYRLDPAKAEARREHGRRMAAIMNAKRWGS